MRNLGSLLLAEHLDGWLEDMKGSELLLVLHRKRTPSESPEYSPVAAGAYQQVHLQLSHQPHGELLPASGDPAPRGSALDCLQTWSRRGESIHCILYSIGHSVGRLRWR